MDQTCKEWHTCTFKGKDNGANVRMLHYGSLSSSCNWLSFLATQDENDYVEIRDEIAKIIATIEFCHAFRLFKVKETTPYEVDDLVIIHTKGRPTKVNSQRNASIKCKLYRGKGYNRITCPIHSQDDS